MTVTLHVNNTRSAVAVSSVLESQFIDKRCSFKREREREREQLYHDMIIIIGVHMTLLY